jgi:hypothetical protein
MSTIAIDGFSGIIPRSGPTRLPVSNAQLARNVKLQSGELRPWQKPLTVFTPANANVKAIYQHYNPDRRGRGGLGARGQRRLAALLHR